MSTDHRPQEHPMPGQNPAPVHKAAPGPRDYHCGVCGQVIKSVPGGSGPVWVHVDSGAVAAPNPPGRP